MASKLPNLVDQFVAKRLRRRRLEIRISQEELGRRLGLTFQQIQKYENATNRISAGRLVEVANALDTDVYYFLNGVQAVEAAMAGRGPGAIEPDVADLLAEFLSIDDPDVRRELIESARQALAAARTRPAENA